MKDDKCGVYQIKNKVNGKVYIGSSKHIEQRWKSHIRDLQKGIHHSVHLQNAWNKYGEDAFIFSVLECCEEFERYDLEQKYIDKYESYKEEKGYNIFKNAHVPSNPLQAEQNISNSLKAQNRTGENGSYNKFTENQVIQVINLLQDSNNSFRYIAEETGTNIALVASIKTKDSWTYLTKDIVFPPRSTVNYQRTLSAVDVQEIVQYLLNGKTNREIAEIYNVTPSCINSIRTHKNWKQYTEGLEFPVFDKRNGKINKDDVLDIIDQYNNGKDMHTIANNYNVRYELIWFLLTGRTWKEYSHLITRDSHDNEIRHYSTKLTEEDVRDIIQMYKNGVSVNDINMKYFYVSKTTIRNIINFKSWKHISR